MSSGLLSKNPPWLGGTEEEGEGGTNLNSSIEIYTLPCVKQIASEKLLHNTGSSALCSVRPKGVGWSGWEGGSRKMKKKVVQSCLTLCNRVDYTVHGILQARILEWVAFPFSRGSSQPRDQTQVACIAGRFFTRWATGEAQENWRGRLKRDAIHIYMHIYTHSWFTLLYGGSQHNIVRQLSSN